MRLEEGVLKGVSRLIRIPGGAQCDGPQAIPMTVDQGGKGRRVASGVRRQQVGVRPFVLVGHGGSVFTCGGSRSMPCRRESAEDLRLHHAAAVAVVGGWKGSEPEHHPVSDHPW